MEIKVFSKVNFTLSAAEFIQVSTVMKEREIFKGI